MDQLIPIAAKIQDVLGALGQDTNLDLPQIVVVGGQSSGKSSVLESIVGRSFLPRGNGIVTRRPLILQLFHTGSAVENDAPEESVLKAGGVGDNESVMSADSNGSGSKIDEVEWGEFLHLPGKRFYNFNRIREEIIRDTERLTGKNKGISSNPIHLKIFSPYVLHLTLVDLPGIAKVAIGDQPPDIEEQIRSMCLKYITNPNAIILAVTGANTDLANSDALQLARYVDPNGDRTIGVLTKLDLMDPGTDASDILSNKLIPLQKGYIGMINRGQADIDNNLTIREGLKKEMQFFNSHPAYRNLHQKCGTRNLSKNLNSILMHHIKDCLPELKSKISSMIHDLNLELQSLGMPSSGEGTSNEAGMLLTLLSKFTANFSNCIDGRGNLSGNNNFETNEVYGGARISFIFNQVFVRSLMSIQPFDGLTDEEIRTTICNANGTRTSLFVPEISFDILVKKQISRLEQPGLQCVDLVFDELQKIASQCEPSEFTRFPNLREQMVEVVSSLLRRCVQPTQMMVSNLIKIELSYINTSHPDFIGGSKAVAKLMEKMSREEEKNKNNPNGMDSNMAGYQSPFHSGSRPTSTTSTISNTNGFKDAVEHDLEETDNNKDPKEREGGALMNFIFEGKKDNTSSNSMNKTRSAYGDQNSGPPSIIQLPQVPSTMRQPTMPTDREKIETEIIKSLIYSYFSIIRKNFIDMVPKTIMYFLVNHARDSMQNELVKELYKDKLVPDLMQEAEDIAQRRRTCGEMRDLLNKALEIVNEVRDFNTFK